ncbi:Ca-activated chloride channel family protein [Ereboglobus sp. PH5-10]|uniref:VIT domain-containing protein n=1 Tax=Ereboglobus sp. PH5-10 TaxID=2940629 RepID=UPI0024071081|nr:VIT domain-containing protein [Ereboglobus sp. PH5-10]MDF9828624.1 Ca-activated chloride channel family protein [Ereboglobus sp. PH5-10]
MKSCPLPRGFALLAVFLLILTPIARAQIALNPTDPKAERVLIRSADISTEITGRFAVTTFDLVFANPNGRDLEGTFEFPLLDGQRVVRFALDINGALREAVPVEKEKGRVVFEEIERRNVDPGLLEQTAGNNYRARIFPIPANGTRRIVIAYQEDLMAASTATNNTPRYRLALDFPDALKTFNFTASVFAAPGAEPAKASTTLALELPAWRDAQTLNVKKENFIARGVLELELPSVFASIDLRPAVITETFNGREYFYAEASVSLPAAAPMPRATPKCVGILWDASGSGRARDHEREFALLDAWFAAVRNVEVRLVFLRNTASDPVVFKVRDGKWAELRAALEKTIYDGATSFDGIADDESVGEWLLFSDGLINFGATQNLEKLPLRAPVHAINASASAAPVLLRKLAASGGGEFVDLIAIDANAARYRLRWHSLSIVAVERDPEAVAQVFPEAGTPLPSGNTIIVTGILRKSEATVRLKIGLTGRGVLGTVDVPVRSGENPSTLAARAWAVAKIEALAASAGDNREDIRRTSREFRIVTPDTSLIVLETLADYIRYDIEPPAELRDEWLKQRRATDAVTNKNRTQQIDRVVKMFDERVKWWEKKFPKDTPKPKVAEKEKRATEETRSDVVTLERFAVSAARSRAPARSQVQESVVLADSPVPAASFFSVSELDRPGFKDGRRVDEPPVASIALQRWSPSASYLDRLRRAPEAERFSIYLEERADHAREPGFYLDVAGYFFDEAKHAPTALQILSNLAELGLEDAALLRVLGHRLTQAGRPDLALPVFERVLKIRGEEPQSRRDLALVCAKLEQYQRAVDLLWEVVSRKWDGRFPEIEMIALGELNAIIATHEGKIDASKIDRRLLKNLSAGLRVILTWDADNCDIDLWVDDPNGERAMYNHPLTYQGGRMSRDFTGGYGPEEFLVRTPKAGKYTVRINYYGDSRQTALGPVTAQVRLITDFGTASEKEKLITVRLVDKKEELEIGSIVIGE